MKKGFLVLAWMGLFLGLHAQDTLRIDSLLRARQSEAEVFVQKGDLYHAAFDYQLVLDQSLHEHRKAYILNAYNALIHISEKCFNYPKAFFYQSAYYAYRDSLQKEQNSRALFSQEAAFKQYESDLNKAQEIEKARAQRYEDMLHSSQKELESLHMLVYILSGLCVLLCLGMVFCLLRLRRSKSMPPPMPQAPVIVPVSSSAPPVEKSEKAGASAASLKAPAAEVAAPVLPRAELADVAGITERFRSNKLEAVFESAHAPELFMHATQAASADPLVLLMLASAGMEERPGLLSLTERSAAFSKTQTPGKVLAEVLEANLNRSAIYAVFDLKGGWLRFAGTQAAVWLIRKGELKEFGGFGAADKAESALNSTVQTLGLRKADWLFLVLGADTASDNRGIQALQFRDALLKTMAAEPALSMNAVRATLLQARQTCPDLSILVVGI